MNILKNTHLVEFENVSNSNIKKLLFLFKKKSDGLKKFQNFKKSNKKHR